MKKIKISVPTDIDFSSLRLARNPQTGAVSFDWAPIERICECSGIDINIYRRGHEDNVAGLIVTWYAEHLARGGAPDPVADELVTEALIEDEHGGGFSHPPGRG